MVPAISHMIMDFGLASNRSETGYYTAPILGAQYFGIMISSMPWGHIADRYGRRIPLLISIACIGITCITIGLALDYWSVLVSHFVFGAFAPIRATAKAWVGDFASDSDMAYLLGLVQLGWTGGTLLGSLLGGGLVHPEEMGLISAGIFVDFPYLLPFLIVAAFAALLFIAFSIWFPETLGQTRTQGTKKVKLGLTQIKLLILDGLISYIVPTYLNIYSLWLWADSEKGGLSFSQSEIGTLIFVSMILFLVLFKCFHRWITKRWGPIQVLFVWEIFGAVLILATSFINLVQNIYITWALLILSYTSGEVIIVLSIVNHSALLNNSVPKRDWGYINGVSNFVGMITAMLAFFFNGILFAWSTNFQQYGIDHHFMFVIVAIVSIIAAVLAKWLPKSLEKSYDESSYLSGRDIQESFDYQALYSGENDFEDAKQRLIKVGGSSSTSKQKCKNK